MLATKRLWTNREWGSWASVGKGICTVHFFHGKKQYPQLWLLNSTYVHCLYHAHGYVSVNHFPKRTVFQYTCPRYWERRQGAQFCEMDSGDVGVEHKTYFSNSTLGSGRNIYSFFRWPWRLFPLWSSSRCEIWTLRSCTDVSQMCRQSKEVPYVQGRYFPSGAYYYEAACYLCCKSTAGPIGMLVVWTVRPLLYRRFKCMEYWYL